MARTGVTFDDIAQAATKLLSLGESPSVQRVREVLGTGSNSTIAGHLKLWKEQRSKKEGVTLPESIPKALIPPLETLWHVALEQSDSRYLAHKEDTLRKSTHWRPNVTRGNSNAVSWRASSTLCSVNLLRANPN